MGRVDFDHVREKMVVEHPFQISPVELKERLDRGDDLQILDVREPFEFGIANLGGTLLPLGQLPQRFEELDSAKEIVVLCHHGVRSAQATAFLRHQGFPKVMNLTGGIDRWSLQIDPKTPRY